MAWLQDIVVKLINNRLFTELINNVLLCKRLLKASHFQNFIEILGEYL